MNKVINSLCNTGEKIKSAICDGVSDFIFLYAEKIKSEICYKISDFIFLYAEKIKSKIFVPFGHRTKQFRKFHFCYLHKYKKSIITSCYSLCGG